MQEAIKRIKAMVEASNIGLWDWHLPSDKVHYSPEWKRQIGYAEHEISDDYMEWESRIHPDDLERAKAKILSFIKNPWPNYSNEFRLRHKNGSYRWILATASIQYGNDHEPERLMGSHIDITEWKKREQTQRRSKELLHKAQRVASIGGWWYDPEVMVPEWTEGVFRIFGMNPHSPAPTYSDHNKLIHPDDWARFDRTFSRAVSEGTSYDTEFRIIREDGEIRHVHSICQPVINAQGKVTELNGTLQDITERKMAEEAVIAGQEQYRNLFESIRDAILLADTERNIIGCNQALVDVFGYEKT